MKTLICLLLFYVILGAYFEYQNKQENEEEIERDSS